MGIRLTSPLQGTGYSGDLGTSQWFQRQALVDDTTNLGTENIGVTDQGGIDDDEEETSCRPGVDPLWFLCSRAACQDATEQRRDEAHTETAEDRFAKARSDRSFRLCRGTELVGVHIENEGRAALVSRDDEAHGGCLHAVPHRSCGILRQQLRRRTNR